jgi:hypothetical protein
MRSGVLMFFEHITLILGLPLPKVNRTIAPMRYRFKYILKGGYYQEKLATTCQTFN